MANLIAENIYSQVDEEGQQNTLMSEMIDQKPEVKQLQQRQYKLLKRIHL